MTTLDTTATINEPPPAYREPAYLRYISGQAISIIGDQVWYVALSWAAVRMTSPGVAGLVLAVSAIPRLALMLFGGAIVDRFSPRRLMIGSDAARAAVSLAAAAVALWSPGLTLLVLVSLAFGVADALFMPAAGTMAPRLLRPAQLASGSALSTLTARIALTLGAPLGGLLVAWGGLPLAAIVNAITFVASIVALSSVHPREAAQSATRTPMLASLRAGLGYVCRHRQLRLLILVTLLSNLGFVGPMNVGLALVSDARGWSSQGIGLLLSGFGAGAVVGALAMLRVRLPERRVAVYAIAILSLVQGISVFAIAIAGSLPFAAGATVIVGLASGPLAIIINSRMQLVTADQYRGRVSSLNTLLSLGVTPLAMVVMGVAAASIGLVATFAASGSIEVAAGVLSFLANRRLVDSAEVELDRVVTSHHDSETKAAVETAVRQ